MRPPEQLRQEELVPIRVPQEAPARLGPFYLEIGNHWFIIVLLHPRQ